MEIITWKEQYAVGIDRIDQEHRTLIKLINKAYGVYRGVSDADSLSELAAYLRGYALKHFETEETLMREHGFPRSAAHIKRHDDFRHQLVESEELDPGVVFEFLARWLAEHILNEDRALADYLRGQGLS